MVLEFLAEPLAIVTFAIWFPLELLLLKPKEVGRESRLNIN